jgi:hypothetical protein
MRDIYIYKLYTNKKPEIILAVSQMGARGSVVVKALCYKPEGRGFDSR